MVNQEDIGWNRYCGRNIGRSVLEYVNLEIRVVPVSITWEVGSGTVGSIGMAWTVRSYLRPPDQIKQSTGGVKTEKTKEKDRALQHSSINCSEEEEPARESEERLVKVGRTLDSVMSWGLRKESGSRKRKSLAVSDIPDRSGEVGTEVRCLRSATLTSLTSWTSAVASGMVGVKAHLEWV